ncbi:MAG: hypothetical protein R2747_12710 [Pyrinomonadaceae bacterium]
MKVKNFILAASVCVWMIVIGVGFVWITDYSSRPSLPANISPHLPEGVFPEAVSDRPKILLFVHPKCVCSRATMSELARMVSDTEGLSEIKIFFYKPAGQSEEWVKTDLWEKARRIPGVSIGTMNEDQINKFGVVTSGQVILYDGGGDLVFSGGITLGRGHEGKSKGREAIETFLRGGRPEIREMAVFGCSLTSTANTF